MSILWLIRWLMIIGLIINIVIESIILKKRDSYPKLIENKFLNLLDVIFYNLCCFLAAGIIPNDTEIINSYIIDNGMILPWAFRIIGTILLITALIIFYLSISIRKVVGLQNTKKGLITDSIYSVFRHPIYTGIVYVSIGLSLLTLNVDGWIILPIIIILNISQAKIEEVTDLIPRFGEEYLRFKKKVKMFGSFRFSLIWIALVLISIALEYIF